MNEHNPDFLSWLDRNAIRIIKGDPLRTVAVQNPAREEALLDAIAGSEYEIASITWWEHRTPDMPEPPFGGGGPRDGEDGEWWSELYFEGETYAEGGGSVKYIVAPYLEKIRARYPEIALTPAFDLRKRRGRCEKEQIALHDRSKVDRSALRPGTLCGCFYCGALFDASEIVQFADHDRTPVCPKCHIDSVLSVPSVIPAREDVATMRELLADMSHFWFSSPVMPGCEENFMAMPAITPAHLEAWGVSFGQGLDEEELCAMEQALGVTFPEDYRAFLKTCMPLGEGFPDYRDRGDENLSHLRAWMAQVKEGLMKAIGGGYWCRNWGARPDGRAEEILQALPPMLPLYRHRYLALVPDAYCGQVISAVGQDMVYHGKNYAESLAVDLGGYPMGHWQYHFPEIPCIYDVLSENQACGREAEERRRKSTDAWYRECLAKRQEGVK